MAGFAGGHHGQFCHCAPPEQPRNVRGTPQVFQSQPNASCSLAPGNGPKCHLRPQTCHSERTSASSRRTPPHNISISKAFFRTSQILTHPKELNGHARRVSTSAFDSYVPRRIAPQNRHGISPHQSREELEICFPPQELVPHTPLNLEKCIPLQELVQQTLQAQWRSVCATGTAAMSSATGAFATYTAGSGEKCSMTGLAAGAGAMYSTTEAGAAYTAVPGEMYSTTGHPAGAGVMYSTTEAGASCTAGPREMYSTTGLALVLERCTPPQALFAAYTAGSGEMCAWRSLSLALEQGTPPQELLRHTLQDL